MKTRVLVIEPGVSRGALAAARSLARAGNEVAVAGQARGPASWSRATTRFHHITAATEDADRFTQEVAGVVRDNGYEVVLAAGDSEALVLSARRDDIPALVPYPPHGVLVGLGDKLDLCERARAVGLRTPDTAPATHEAISAIGGPTVVKSRLHGDLQRGAQRVDTEIADTPEEAGIYVARISAAGLEPLLQEVIGGHLMAVALVLGRDGSVLGLVQQRAQLTWPARAGISARAVVEDVDRALADRIVNLLRESGFYGLAEVQLIDPGDDAPYLIDVNPRIYGSLGLAIAAGVDLPNLALADALERPAEAAGSASTGVRYQWLEGELRRAFEDGRPLAGTIAALRYAPGATHSISSLRDPAPVFRHGLDLVRRAIRKVSKRS